MNYSPPGSSVHGTLQARILEWVAISYFRGSSQHRDPTPISRVSCIAGRFFTTSTTWEASLSNKEREKEQGEGVGFFTQTHITLKQKTEKQLGSRKPSRSRAPLGSSFCMLYSTSQFAERCTTLSPGKATSRMRKDRESGSDWQSDAHALDWGPEQVPAGRWPG